MTKTCVVCKKYPVSGDNTRSFHKFPFNEDIKKKWMDITGISKVTVNCTVCSDHFTPQSYHNTEGFGSLKRLLRNAVPIVNKTGVHKVEKSTEESKVDKGKNTMCEENTNLGQSQLRKTDNENTNAVVEFEEQCYSNDSSENSADEIISMDKMNNRLKRKIPAINIKPLNIKRMFRFRDGVETKYISREEFVSEEAWEKFLRLMLLNKRRMEGLRQRLYRKKKMLDSGQLYDSVKLEDCNPETFLEVILKE